MTMQCGLVGLPNVGKSTIFNAITCAGAQSENYPFCTIEPNVGRVNVPDNRLNKLVELVKPRSVISAATEFVDIAGLVEGASKGEGLGNKFLSHIRETDATAHIIRCFEDSNIVHVRGKIDPADDIRIINLELILADMESLSRQMKRLEKIARSGEKMADSNLELAVRILKHLENEAPVRTMNISAAERVQSNTFHLLTDKPMLFVANVAEKDIINGNDFTAVVESMAAEENSFSLRICGRIEEEIVKLEEEEQKEYLAEMKLTEPGLNRMVRASYSLLNLITFFTAGPEEVRAWTIKKESRAPEAAGVIHSDMERGFICAEVISYNDVIAAGSLSGARDVGKMRLEGKEYIIKDGDVCFFRFNV